MYTLRTIETDPQRNPNVLTHTAHTELGEFKHALDNKALKIVERAPVLPARELLNPTQVLGRSRKPTLLNREVLLDLQNSLLSNLPTCLHCTSPGANALDFCLALASGSRVISVDERVDIVCSFLRRHRGAPVRTIINRRQMVTEDDPPSLL